MNFRAPILIASLFSIFGLNTLAETQPPKHLTSVKFLAPFKSNSQISPFAYGIEKGYYRDEGIDLTIIEGPGGKGAALEIAKDVARFGGSDANVVADLATEGSPIKVISSFMQSSPSALAFIAEKGYRDLAALKGKKIGFGADSSTFALFPALAAANKMSPKDFTIVTLERSEFYDALKSGRVDAIGLASISTKSAEKYVGKPLTSMRYATHGLPLPGDVMIVNNKYLISPQDRALNCRMVRASSRSWTETFTHPKEAVEALHKIFPKTDSGNQEVTLDGLLRVIELSTMRKILAKPIGYTFPEDWQRLFKTLQELKMIKAPKPLDNYFTNEYLGCDPLKVN
jgi:NitT/TauT family transport system substrate-binding protein